MAYVAKQAKLSPVLVHGFLTPPRVSYEASSVKPRNMGLPGLNLHPLKGARQGTWAVRVSGNWRLTFRFEGRDVADVNYEDYH